VIKKVSVPGINENAGGAVNEIGVTVVGGHRFPHKSVDVICDLHFSLSLVSIHKWSFSRWTLFSASLHGLKKSIIHEAI